ncbi:MAG: hypothetical protein AB7R55_17890 [Gemmatimonadales bacterium]
MLRLPTLMALAVWVTTGCAAKAAGQREPVTQPLVTASIAGQSVALLPLTMVVADPDVRDSALARDREALIKYGDSLVTEAMLARAPEIDWIPPAELRRMARRSGGLVPDPDRMGQSVMRSSSLKTVPDPLRSNLRKLISIAGNARYALIPAALYVRADSTGQIESDLNVLLADSRTGRVVWRSVAKGTGSTAAAAVARAVETIFPPEGS